MNTDVAISKYCYHCGECCDEGAVYLDDKPFCCSGCKMVYEILDSNNLTTYYCLEEQPGVSLKNFRGKKRFDYLDDPSVINGLTDFNSGGYVSATFYIPNIHCTSCVWLLENIYKLDEGVTKSSVNFLKRELSVTFDEDKTTLRVIVELLASIGYEPELRLEKLNSQSPASPDRRLWMKLGVAGFAFGNIMLFSFPEYLSGSTLSSQGSFHLFFGILNIALALPVLLYSSSDYLKSAWAALKQGGINLDVPITVGILALFGRSLYEIISATGAGYMDSFTGLVFFLLIGRLIQKKTYERLTFDRDYRSYLPISITVLDEKGQEQALSIDKLKEGMCMLVRNRELVPADATLESENCFVDYSFITGESEPVEIQRGETVYAGGKVMGPSVEMRTVKEVSTSYLTKLWNNAAFEKSEQRKNRSSLAERISPHFTLAVLGIAVTAAILWWPTSAERGLTVFTAVLIIACPCALALSTPFTLGSTLNILSRNGLYIKGIEVIERLANATSIVFDKTGTLTRAEEAEISFRGTLSPAEQSMVKKACRQSMHPLSQKIASHLPGDPAPGIAHFKEVINRGLTATVDGRKIVLGSATFIQEQLKSGDIRETDYEKGASVVHLALDGEWRGAFEITNSYRGGIRNLLSQFKKQYSTFLISGDNDSQRATFAPYFEDDALLFERTPQQKLDFIRQLQDSGQHIVMVGDGLNDAGALQQSDFGIALTDNISSFTPACDAILDGQSLRRMNKFIDFSKTSITIIKCSFFLSLLYNMVGLGFAVSGQLSPLVAAILMPLSSISIMAFTTASTHLQAKRMGLRTWR